jgi:Tol biopolymer transport system component
LWQLGPIWKATWRPKYDSRPEIDYNLLFRWFVGLATDANLRRLTNDLNEYNDVSLTADGKSLGTPQKQMSSSIWIAQAANPTQAKEISGAGRMDGVRGLAWLPDGRLLYMGSETAPQIWQMDRDGRHRQQVTHLPGNCQGPGATADGSTLWFSYANNIWRMDADGSNARQVTTTKNSAWNAEVSPDGKWLTYYTREGPWKVASDGGSRPSLYMRLWLCRRHKRERLLRMFSIAGQK